MGRYLTGDFKWKFTFGDQSSSFGRVIEKICKNLKNCHCNRVISTEEQGEYVELDIGDEKEFFRACKKFIGKNFMVRDLTEWCPNKNKFGDRYWDKLMIREFMKEKKNFKGCSEETLHFYVEY